MSYLKFDKGLMVNLQQSLFKELLQTNRSGAYSYSTIVDCNTRKYNGLLVVPLPRLDGKNHVLISSLDATVIQHGAEFNLGLHKYPGDNYSPKGHKYISQFECDSIPTTIYRVGGVILSREKIFMPFDNRILIRYTLLEAHSPTRLRFRPFLAFRNTDSLSRENAQADRSYEPVENGIRVKMYPGYPDLYMQFSSKNEFSYAPDWYHNIEYMKEQERGYDFQEDQYVPGTFEMPIRKGQSIVFSAALSPMSAVKMRKAFEEEKLRRKPRTSFTECLKAAAHQFYNKDADGQRYLLAGYPWFACRARDMFVALPGCTLSADDPDLFESIMLTAEKGLRNFMAGQPLDCAIREIDAPDVLLWAVWTVQQYAKSEGMEQALEKYGQLVLDIIEYLTAGHHPNLALHENGLVWSEGKNRPVSWMNSTMYDRPLVPRSGYLVEFNALWYNALCFAKEIADLRQEDVLSDNLQDLIKRVDQSYVQVFRNEHGYLFDYVDGSAPDWSVRPNQIFAASLDYSPLNKMQKKQVLDIVTKELLTPKGLRTLSPKSMGYNPVFEGPEDRRTWAYHQGTAWPWLMGAYLEAYLKIYRMSGLSFAERCIYNFEDDLTDRGITSISELFDGNPPYRGRGGIAFAMSVAEILRVKRLIMKMSEE